MRPRRALRPRRAEAEAEAEEAGAEGAEMEEVEAEDIPIVQEVRGEDEAAPPEQGCGGERCAAAEPREQEQEQEGEGATPHLTRAEGGGPEPTATEYDGT